MHLVSCSFVVWLFCCLGGVFSFNMVGGAPAVQRCHGALRATTAFAGHPWSVDGSS